MSARRIPQAVASHLAERALMLDRDDVEAIAQRVAQLLSGETTRYLDAATIADRSGIRVSVYADKVALGAVRLGRGPRARLRFDVRRVEALLAEQRLTVVSSPSVLRRAGVQARPRPKRPVLGL